MDKLKGAEHAMYQKLRELANPDILSNRRASRRLSYHNNKEKCSAQHKLWRSKNKEKVYAQSKRWRVTHRDHVLEKVKFRKYGITQKEYNKLLKAQNGVCFICGNPPKNRSLNIDHEHVRNYSKMLPEEKKQYIRGLLCFGCNRFRMAGRITTQETKRMTEYLERYQRGEVL